MQNTNPDSNPKATTWFSGLIFILGIICTGIAAVGIFWLSKIIPGIYQTLAGTDFSFMSNSVVFHLLWVVFFLSLLMTGVKLLISALNKRTTDLVPGVSLYFLGASLLIIGLFYLLFGQLIYALISIIAGTFFIYVEGTTELA
ncbi:MAG: hypothetical protein GKR92_03775 [Gammaproteobacteria bacterium]|nr:MAG: hypothetical protein GKR92_03775 [Gammaproteobacteria bacterium]